MISVAVLAVSVIAQQPWVRHDLDPNPIAINSTSLGNLSREGLPYVLANSSTNRLLRVYQHPPRLKSRATPFWTQTTLDSICAPSSAILSDLDQDGSADILTLCGEHRPTGIYVYWGPLWAPESLPAPNPVIRWTEILTFQKTLSSRPQIIAGGRSSFAELSLYSPGLHSRDVNQWTGKVLELPAWITCLRSIDLNADGEQDILVGDRKSPNGGIYWMDSDGWTRHDVESVPEQVVALDVGDLNSDGSTDILAAIYPDRLAWYRRVNSSATQWLRQDIPYPPQAGAAQSIALGDMNLDGRPDLVLTCESATEGREGVWWLEQVKGGFWRFHRVSGPQGIKFGKVHLLDIDGDSDLDILTSEERLPLGAIWFENPSRN